MRFTLAQAASICNAALDAPNPLGSLAFAGIATDTRKDLSGALFIALKGANFDAHDFLLQAQEQGACAALVSRDYVRAEDVSLPLLRVADVRIAMGELASAWRQQFVIPVIGVTGSNGKTSVKEMCAAILRHALGDDAVLATTGNLNNDIGVPLMLAQLTPHHQAAVIEMGMNHPGEIGYLVNLVHPRAAIVTNAQRAHLAGMGDLSAVAREKGTIYSGLEATGTAVINADDPQVELWLEQNSQRAVILFSVCGNAQRIAASRATSASTSWIEASAQAQGWSNVVHITLDGEPLPAVTLAVPGAHNVSNACAAFAACVAVGIPKLVAVDGIAAYQGTSGRLQLRVTPEGAQLLDDTYNANPDSVRAGINVLAQAQGERILVLGDMGETGPEALALHTEVGAWAKQQGIQHLLTLGTLTSAAVAAFGDGARHFDGVEELVQFMRPQLSANTRVLVKGSRFMKMERVTQALCQSN